MTKTTFRFWGGLTTIGGNIVEIRHGDDRVIFDFGRAYNPADVLLDKAQGREGRRVADMLRLGMIPPIDGIYNRDDLKNMPDLLCAEEWTGQRKGTTAVFISHKHLDHMGAIDTLAWRIPVYMSSEGAALHEALMEIGEGPIRGVFPFSYEVPIQIGAIKVTGYAIDHDVHGASAILVETPDLRIAHSGDIRMRGHRPGLNRSWIKKMREKKLDYLLMEGTSFWPPRDEESNDNRLVQLPEPDVSEAIAEKLAAASGVGFFNFYHRNLSRMKNLMDAAKNAGRTIVFEPPTARLAARFFSGAAYRRVLGESITVKEINDNPSAFFVQNTLPNVFSLIDYNPAGSVYIHTNGIPLGPFDPAFGSMVSLLGGLGIEFAIVSSSGHGDTEEILQIIDGIKPKTLMPWHSTTPGEMIPLNARQKVIMPEYGKWYK
jgi:ribonuclease J